MLRAFGRASLVLALTAMAAGGAWAQINLPGAVTPAPEAAPAPAAPAKPAIPDGHGALGLIAVYGSEDRPVGEGIIWRVFRERAEPDGSHKLLRRSTQPSARFVLPFGNYVVHAAWGLAGVSQRVEIKAKAQKVKLVLNAGALKITGMLESAKIAPDRLSAAIYIPDGKIRKPN